MKHLKGLLKSKVFWFNAVTGTLEIVNVFNTVIPHEVSAAIITIGNIALRFLTDRPLNEK